MLFPYSPVTELKASAVKIQKENLKQFEYEHFMQFSIYALIENRTLFCDHLLCDLWQKFKLSEQKNLTLLAVGGYGRAEMFPLSDLDFLILTEQPLDQETEENVRQFIQFLWDSGFDVGQAVRTLTQCQEAGLQDITIATNLLEARYLMGNFAQFTQLMQQLQQPDFWPCETFFNAKTQERTVRYQRYNNTSYNLEPDIKHSPGGLRDLHLLYWIALRHTGAKNLDEILASGFIYPVEYRLLQESQQCLFKVRFALHLILKRYDNRLLFERQIQVADLLGFKGEGNQGVEKMMKIFFQALQTISFLSDLLVKHYREHFLQSSSPLHIEVLDPYFQLVNRAICLRYPTVFTEKPEQILNLFFHLTAHPEADIHSSTLRQLHLALEQLQGHLCDDALARETFLRLFNQPKAIERAFVPMHKYGVLSAYLPQWKQIEGLMQFDLFHCYTVDEHILRTLLKLEYFLTPESVEVHPVCSRLFPRLTDRTLLYIAALFHDIAKGRGGDHAQLGAIDVAEFAQLHGFDQREIQTLVWLVEQHLLMSVTAQRRDIHDPEVVLNFAEAVQNQVRLDYLTCLTVADICATNETLWNSWKRTLIATLYQFTHQQFDQGMDCLLDHQQKIAEHREQALDLLSKTSLLTVQTINEIWQRCPDEYFLRNTPKQIAWHTQLLSELKENLLVKISNRFSEGGTEIFVYCQDQPNLFNHVVTTIGSKKLSIHDAQIITSHDGYVFDSFIVTEVDGTLLKFDRRRSLEKVLTHVLSSPSPMKNTLIPNRKLRHFSVKTEIRFLKENRTDQTEMELFALDQTGLLAKVSQVFTELKLTLLNAKITTIGERAEDFFILTNDQNRALTASQREELEKRLHQVLR
ncbi:bifunctional uridylyltransferase/uridylyl-removing protein GlnD [Pasteurella sp. P03HT]